MLLQGQKISFRYDDDWLFKDADFSVSNHSKIGIVGKNGTGKSTLFRLILGEIKPESGCIAKSGRLLIGYLPQDLAQEYDLTLAEFLGSRETEPHLLKKAAALFGFSQSDLDSPISRKSGGEKTRCALCRVYLKNPDVLLLDEPTNHLDRQHMEWLEGFLSHTGTPYLIISHDRRFLDHCAQEIWEIDSRVIKARSGNYSVFMEEKRREISRQFDLYESQQKKIRCLKSDFLKKKQWAETFQKQTQCGGSDTYKVITNDARRAMKRAINIKSRIERMLDREEAVKPVLPKKRAICFNSRVPENSIVLKAENLCKYYGSHTVFRGFGLDLANSERLGIVGKNGSGKSSLLNILAGRDADFNGSVVWVPTAAPGYYTQELEFLDHRRTVLEEVSGRDPDREELSRTILGCLNIRRDKVFQRTRSLSRGEAMKVMLARIICSDANVLLLDEPTSHLEIAAIEELEHALLQFPGAVIFTTHDRYFLERIADRSMNLEEYQ
ncbi:MAG: ABC-F family ATP-binding cassette domain-containing protein [Candidatus Wallbacteria bacterium]|nr:ABC-F family ATP-binding cassette domain-containing protein [Candidatus Wallbacteria bacterium]